MTTLPHRMGSTQGEPVDWTKVAQDPSLTLSARGLYTLFSSFPGRLFSFGEICSLCTDTPGEVRNSLIELTARDLVERRGGWFTLAGQSAGGA